MTRAVPETVTDIDARSLVKRYGHLTAVDGVSFSVQRGEIFGILGPNGAGKTTTLEMLEGLRTPDGGEATVLGSDIVRDARSIKGRIGVQLQATALPPFTKVREVIDLFGAFYEKRVATADLLTQFDLSGKANDYSDKLSGGQMQRLSLALAVVNDPDLVFLDEPTTGLDPQARRDLWDVIEGIRARGRTVVLTTHYMEEAERLCDRVAIMEQGRIAALDTPVGLIAEHAPATVVDFEPARAVDEAKLQALDGVDGVTAGSRVQLRTMRSEVVLRALLDPDARWTADDEPSANAITDLRIHQGTLEDVFIALAGRGLGE
jgi:ABC-2 type transport system ATP-binding protein